MVGARLEGKRELFPGFILFPKPGVAEASDIMGSG
jgi:hypothetical protein